MSGDDEGNVSGYAGTGLISASSNAISECLLDEGWGGETGSSPEPNEIVPKATTGAINSSMANLVDPAVVVLVPKELDTSFLGKAGRKLPWSHQNPLVVMFWNGRGRLCRTSGSSDSEESESCMNGSANGATRMGCIGEVWSAGGRCNAGDGALCRVEYTGTGSDFTPSRVNSSSGLECF